MRVLVTGASSFEGDRVISELLGQGHTVVGISRTPADIDHERYTWHCMDLSNERYAYALGNLSPSDDPIRAVIHCAPARYLPVVREAMARHTGIILSGDDWKRAWFPIPDLMVRSGDVHVAAT
jgi:nucleoside-diphosphate-sugar epimerase